ncbi:MAG: DUF433 domain-containing protein [Microcystis aeruginosa L211-11]|nr:DUF433 domain-containing protein [Microcystis aeruginosa L211-11]
MDWETRITLNPDILVGKPIIKGTRIAVEFIIDLLAQGWGIDEILRNYPGITVEDIQACLSYASVMQAENRILLTFDQDFGELAFRSRLPASVGIILFRIRVPSASVVAEKVAKVISLRDDWYGHFTVIEEDKIRMRDLTVRSPIL